MDAKMGGTVGKEGLRCRRGDGQGGEGVGLERSMQGTWGSGRGAKDSG